MTKKIESSNFFNLITIVIAAIALIVSMRSCSESSKTNVISLESNTIAKEAKNIALESKKYTEDLQTSQIWREKLFKLAQISSNLEYNIFYMKTNMPKSKDCRIEILGLIEEAEKTRKYVNSHYNYIKDSKDSTSNLNAIEIELSMPEIDRLFIETSKLEEMAKNKIKYCEENQKH